MYIKVLKVVSFLAVMSYAKKAKRTQLMVLKIFNQEIDILKINFP